MKVNALNSAFYALLIIGFVLFRRIFEEVCVFKYAVTTLLPCRIPWTYKFWPFNHVITILKSWYPYDIWCLLCSIAWRVLSGNYVEELWPLWHLLFIQTCSMSIPIHFDILTMSISNHVDSFSEFLHLPFRKYNTKATSFL